MLQLYTHTPHMRKNMAAVMSEWNFYYFVQLRQKTEMTSLSTNHLSSRFKTFKDGRRKARDYIFARHDTSNISIRYSIGYHYEATTNQSALY